MCSSDLTERCSTRELHGGIERGLRDPGGGEVAGGFVQLKAERGTAVGEVHGDATFDAIAAIIVELHGERLRQSRGDGEVIHQAGFADPDAAGSTSRGYDHAVKAAPTE